MRPAPQYMTVADQVASRIAKLAPGARVPSEHELAGMYGLNRLTARAALQELERRRLVRRVQGLGTFVAPRLEYRIEMEGVPSFTASARAAGADPRTETESLRLVRATSDVRAALRLEPRARVYELHRRRYVDDLPAAQSQTFVNAELVPDLPERLPEDGSLYETLVGAYGMRPSRGWLRAQLTLAEEETARRLGLEGRPFVIHTQTRIDCRLHAQPIELTRWWLRADVFSLVAELGTP